MFLDLMLLKIVEFNWVKYVDIVVQIMIDMLIEVGCWKFVLKVKLVGGLEMFKFKLINDLMKIGLRNVLVIKEQLFLFNIFIISEDMGGLSGWMIEFELKFCMLYI